MSAHLSLHLAVSCAALGSIPWWGTGHMGAVQLSAVPAPCALQGQEQRGPRPLGSGFLRGQQPALTLSSRARTVPPSRAVPTAASSRSVVPGSGYTSSCSPGMGSGGGCTSLRTASSSGLLGARNCNTCPWLVTPEGQTAGSPHSSSVGRTLFLMPPHAGDPLPSPCRDPVLPEVPSTERGPGAPALQHPHHQMQFWQEDPEE